MKDWDPLDWTFFFIGLSLALFIACLPIAIIIAAIEGQLH